MKKKQPSLKELQAKGYRVRAGHKRYYGATGIAIYKGRYTLVIEDNSTGVLFPAPLLFKKEALELGWKNTIVTTKHGEKVVSPIYPRGGMTIVELESPSGAKGHGESLCHPLHDNFCKEHGIREALGKALGQIQRQEELISTPKLLKAEDNALI